MSRLTRGLLVPVSRTGLSPAPARRSRRFRYQREQATGLVRFRSPLLAESRLMSFPPATEMFQFAGFASLAYEFSQGYPFRGGLPHSEIPGSTIARISPGLFAACHVLHRLSVPRHPPDALCLARSRRRGLRPAPWGQAQTTSRNPAAHRGKPRWQACLRETRLRETRLRGSPPPSSPDDSAQRLSMKTLVRTVHRAGPADRKLAPADSLPGARGPSASVTFANPFHQSISTAPEPRTRETPNPGNPEPGKPRTRETPNPRRGTPPARGSRTGAKPCSSPNGAPFLQNRFTKPVQNTGGRRSNPISAIRSPPSDLRVRLRRPISASDLGSSDLVGRSRAVASAGRDRRTRWSVAANRWRVEVNGIEPMTSCLQSRRSPS